MDDIDIAVLRDCTDINCVIRKEHSVGIFLEIGKRGRHARHGPDLGLRLERKARAQPERVNVPDQRNYIDVFPEDRRW